MNFNFGSLLSTLEAFFGLVRQAPHEVAQVADAVVHAATPVLDEVAGAGTGAKVTASIETTAQNIHAFLAPKLQEGHDVAQVASAILSMATSGAALATQQHADSGHASE